MQKKHSVLEKHSQTEYLQGPWDSNISMFYCIQKAIKNICLWDDHDQSYACSIFTNKTECSRYHG